MHPTRAGLLQITDLRCWAVEAYNSKVTEVVDKHAPLLSRIFTVLEDSPWYTHTLGDEKGKRRRLERKKQSSGLQIDHDAYIEQINKNNIMCDQVRTNYHQSKILESDSKE